MFREHTHYTATCTACGYTARDRQLSRVLGWPVTLWITSLDPAPVITGAAYSEGPWAVEDGQVHCSDCSSGATATEPQDLTFHLTKVTRYTLHCDACAAPYREEGSEDPARFNQRVLGETTATALAYLEWDAVETTPPQPEVVLVDVPGAPMRTWQVTCPECIEAAAWLHDLASAST
jgi:hypothetical protein